MPQQDQKAPRANACPPYVELKRKHQALEILAALERDNGIAPVRLLAEWLGTVGLGIAGRDLEELLSLLASESLVRLTENGRMLIVHLTASGAEVATGITRNEWVARPSPD